MEFEWHSFDLRTQQPPKNEVSRMCKLSDYCANAIRCLAELCSDFVRKTKTEALFDNLKENGRWGHKDK